MRPLLLLILVLAVLPGVEGPHDARLDARIAAARVAAADRDGTVEGPVRHQVAAAVHAPLSRPDIVGLSIVAPSDPEQVPRYGQVELLLEMESVAGVNPYEPDPARGGIDLRVSFNVPDGGTVETFGFYDGSDYRIRFAPEVLGRWDFVIRVEHAGGVDYWDQGSFTCVESDSPGFLRIDGRAMRFAEGQRFFGIGYNTGWMYEVRVPDFATMADHGVNLLSFWMGVPWARPSDTTPENPFWGARSPLENEDGGVGFYQPEAADYLDAVVADAEANGVYLLPSIWAHDQLRDEHHTWPGGRWDMNPYRHVIPDPADWYLRSDGGGDSEQWILQRNLLRYIIARWGSSTAIAGWVSVVEMNGTNGFSDPDRVLDWATAVERYCAAIDPYRTNVSGQYPMVGTLKNWREKWDPNDLRALDADDASGSDEQVAASLAGLLEQMRTTGEPAFFTEWGGDIRGGATQPRHLHNGLWANAAAGGMCAPLLWCDGGHYPLPALPLHDPNPGSPVSVEPEILTRLAIQADFAASAAVLGDPIAAPIRVSVDRFDVEAYALAAGDHAMAWLLAHYGNDLEHATLTLGDLPIGSYQLAWYDVSTDGATPLAVDTRDHLGGDFGVNVPAFYGPDIALRLQRVSVPNQAPSFTDAGDVAVPATSGAVSLLWASAITAGSPVEDVVQQLTFEVASDEPGLFAVPPQVTLGGELQFTPDGRPGRTTISVTLRDDGGRDSLVHTASIHLTGRDIVLRLEDGTGPIQGVEVILDDSLDQETDVSGGVGFMDLSVGEDHRFGFAPAAQQVPQ